MCSNESPQAPASRQWWPFPSGKGGEPKRAGIGPNDPSVFTWYWQAPAKFLGNVSAAYGKALTYQLTQSNTSAQDNAEANVGLVGAGMTLLIHLSYDPLTTWTSYSVLLDETAGWTKGTISGPAPTKAEMMSVLSSLTALYIRGEWYMAADTGGLDNVILGAPVSGFCPEDVNHDGVVDFRDTVMVMRVAAGLAPCQ